MSKLKNSGPKYSVFFLILMLLVLFGSYKLRSEISMVLSSIETYKAFFNRFTISQNFVAEHPEIFLKINFFASLGIIIVGYFLGKEIAGKTNGIAAAFFLGFYPYFVTNCYSTINIFLLFFMLYLLFELKTFNTFQKLLAIPAGIFFALSIIANPVCILICLISHIYYTIKSKNIIALRIFLFFVLGIVIGLVPPIIGALITKLPLGQLIPLESTFKPILTNFNLLLMDPIGYLKLSITALASTLANPKYYISLSSYTYLHYVIVTLSLLTIFYAFIEEKIRIIFFILILLLLQALFMPVEFELIFLLLIFMASYMIDKTVNDVFC